MIIAAIAAAADEAAAGLHYALVTT